MTGCGGTLDPLSAGDGVRAGVSADGSPRRVARDVMRGTSKEILASIDDAGVAAAIWQRSLAPELQLWLDTLDCAQLPSLRTICPAHLAETVVLSALDTEGLGEGQGPSALARDAGELALAAGAVLKTRYVRLRFDVSRQRSCPKFHVDHVRARLLCTYRGPGTEYVPESALGSPGRCRQMTRGATGLFRGKLWLSAETCGLLHRSPGPASDGKARLLLVIDPAD